MLYHYNWVTGNPHLEPNDPIGAIAKQYLHRLIQLVRSLQFSMATFLRLYLPCHNFVLAHMFSFPSTKLKYSH